MPNRPTVRPSTQPSGGGPDQQSYAFEMQWQAPNGKSFSGRFVHRCPTVGESVTIEVAQAERLRGQMSTDATANLALMIEHLRVTLKERPDWAASIDDIPHAVLLQAVAEEVAAHIARFHGDGGSGGTGAGVGAGQ